LGKSRVPRAYPRESALERFAAVEAAQAFAGETTTAETAQAAAQTAKPAA
jgi:hypothetical protein